MIEDKGLVYRTCLECRKNKLCHPILAVCRECWRDVLRPALLPSSQDNPDPPKEG